MDEKALGREHPDVAADLNNLAVIYKELGNYEEALITHQRVIAIRLSVLSPNHRDVAISLFNLATLYEEQSNYKEALPLFKQAVSIAENTLGNDDPYTMMFRASLEDCQEHISHQE